MIAARPEQLPTGALPERVLTRDQRAIDQMRRHFDAIDADIFVNAQERNYGLRFRATPCPYRPSLLHVEFAEPMHEWVREVIQGSADGYLLYEILRGMRARGLLRGTNVLDSTYNTGEYAALRKRLQIYAKKIGATSWHHLVPIAVHFGICVPSIFIDKGEYT